MRIHHIILALCLIFVISSPAPVRGESVKERLEKARAEEEAQKLKKEQASDAEPIMTPAPLKEKTDPEKKDDKVTSSPETIKNKEQREWIHQEKLKKLEQIKAAEALEDQVRAQTIEAILSNPTLDTEEVKARMDEIQKAYEQSRAKHQAKRLELFQPITDMSEDKSQ